VDCSCGKERFSWPTQAQEGNSTRDTKKPGVASILVSTVFNHDVVNQLAKSETGSSHQAYSLKKLKLILQSDFSDELCDLP